MIGVGVARAGLTKIGRRRRGGFLTGGIIAKLIVNDFSS